MDSSLVKEIVENSNLLQSSDDNVARLKAIMAAYKLASDLETPAEKTVRVAWGEPSRAAALKIAYELSLLSKLSDTPISNV